MIFGAWKRTVALQRLRFHLFIILMVIMILPLWVGGCGSDASKRVAAEVNGERITVQDVQNELAKAPEDMRAAYDQKPDELLDQLVSLKLLLQEAKRTGFVDSTDLQGLNKPSVQEGLRRLLEPAIKDVKVTDQEVADFYQRHRDQMEGQPFSQVREAIRQMVLEQKRQERINNLVGKLRTAGVVTTYPERLPKPSLPPLEASTAEAFQTALQSKRPTIVDFGSNSCVPCIRFRPILRQVKDAHGDRINVLYMEVSDHRDLALRYKVRLVPTVVFFDAKGQEVRRNVGFMDREGVERVLRELKFLQG
jgi:thioredoxin 1